MKTFDIGIDLDGVGYNLQASLAPYAREVGYERASEETWNEIDPETGVHGGFASWGVADYGEFLDLCGKASDDGVLYVAGTPFVGFVPMMKELSRDGHRLHIITARTQDPESGIARATRAWLEQWEVPYLTLTFSSNKAIRRTDLFIEDSTFNYESLLEAGMTVPYLVSRPWNLFFDAEHRVSDLLEFVDEVRRRASQALPLGVPSTRS